MATTTPTETRLRIQRRFKASRQRVFEAWTQPAALKRWFAPSDAYTVPEARVDARVGGAYRITMRTAEGEDHTAIGRYLELNPPVRLVFTWTWEGDDDRGAETRVSVDLAEREGETELTLTHESFPTTELRDRHEQGWVGCLERLNRTLP